MAARLGLECKFYTNTNGVGGSGSWNLVDNVKDVSVELARGEADVTTRNNGGWRATKAALKDATITFESVWDTADARFNELRQAWDGGTTIGCAVLDDVIASGEGLVADCNVIDFTITQELEEAVTVSMTIKPTFSTTAPAWTESGVS